MSRDGRIFLGRTLVAETELAARPAALRTAAPSDAPVCVRGDRMVPYGDVMRVMGQVSAADIARVSIIAEAEVGGPAIQAR